MVAVGKMENRIPPPPPRGRTFSGKNPAPSMIPDENGGDLDTGVDAAPLVPVRSDMA
jgi:hypothetical protein